jgi:hypothetical protein
MGVIHALKLVVSEVAKKLNIVPFSGLIVKVVPRLI